MKPHSFSNKNMNIFNVVLMGILEELHECLRHAVAFGTIREA